MILNVIKDYHLEFHYKVTYVIIWNEMLPFLGHFGTKCG